MEALTQSQPPAALLGLYLRLLEVKSQTGSINREIFDTVVSVSTICHQQLFITELNYTIVKASNATLWMTLMDDSLARGLFPGLKSELKIAWSWLYPSCPLSVHPLRCTAWTTSSDVVTPVFFKTKFLYFMVQL